MRVAPFTRRNAKRAAEHAREIGERVESAIERHVEYALVGVLKHYRGCLDPEIDQVVLGRFRKHRLEQSPEAGGTGVAGGGQAGEVDLAGVLAGQNIQS